uniref:Uncharacterized protein n=1 Tax=Arundo donax TaxID=35708 RepID=A0A0A9GX95_ARUDO
MTPTRHQQCCPVGGLPRDRSSPALVAAPLAAAVGEGDRWILSQCQFHLLLSTATRPSF